MSINEYYEPPKLSEDKKTVTFIARNDKLLDTVTGSDVKIVNVTVPGTFYYLEEGNKVYLNEDIVYSFKINSSTQERITIGFSCPSTEGDLSYSVRKEYNLNEEITSTCTPKQEFVVTGWKVLYSDGTEVEGNILDVEIPEDNTNTITIKVLTGSDKEVIVSPICIMRNTTVVNFDSDFGYTIPSEQKFYSLGDEFTISFREPSDAQFTTWKVYDAANPTKEITDVIQIEAPKALDTKCKVIKTEAVVIIKAESVMRPSILSTNPLYDANGVYRDRRIVVMFDKPMDESSIYYLPEEVTALEKDGYTVLYDEKHNNKPYGYWDGKNDDSIHFKNITISYRREESTLLLKHYYPPYFDETDPTVLRIDPKGIEKQSDGKEIDLLPPAVSDILVTISNKMGAKDEKSNDVITLTKNTRWNYYTNTKHDNEKPVFKNNI